MPTILVPLLAALLALVVCANPAAAAPLYTIQTFTVPNAVAFNVIAINNTGELVGTLRQSDNTLAGFINAFSTGTITTFTDPMPSFPVGLGTTVIGLNDSGTILGTTTLLGYTLRNPDGTLTAAPIPGSAGRPTAINNANQVTINNSGPTPFSSTAALLDLRTGNYTVLNAPTNVSTYAASLNNLGQVVGQYTIQSMLASRGFLYDVTTGSFTIVPDPSGAMSTELVAVNNVGQAIGNYSDSAFDTVGFLLDLATNTETVLPFVGVGINDAGQIVGNLSSTVGFIATPQATPEPTAMPEPATFLLLAFLLLPACAINRQRIHLVDVSRIMA